MTPAFRVTRTFIFFIFFCAASFIISCTPKNSASDNSLKVALSSLPSTLDPRRATDATGMRICNLVFQSLVRIDNQLQVIGDAAESWSFNNNVYEFTLHEDLRFQNGRAISKEDIEFSFDEFRSTKSPFSSAFAPIKKVEVAEKGKHLITRVHVDGFSAKFLSSDLPVLKILPKKEILESEENFVARPLGSGPLKVISLSDQAILLERSDLKERNSKYFNRFEFKVIKDDFTRSQKILKGEVDVAIAEMPPDIIKRLQDKEKHRVSVKTYPGLAMTYILVNLKDPRLSDKKIRKALSQAIDRQKIIRYKLVGLGEEATSILTPNNPYFNPSLKNPPFNPEEARLPLSELKELSLKTSSNPMAVDNGKVLANQLGKAGVKIQLQSFEWGTFYNDLKTGNFQLATMKWVGAFDPDIYRIAFHSKELPPGRNRSHYVNSSLDQLMDQAFRIESFEKRRDIYRQIQKTIFDEYVIIPLWYETQAVILRNNLDGFVTSPLSDYSGLLAVSRTE